MKIGVASVLLLIGGCFCAATTWAADPVASQDQSVEPQSEQKPLQKELQWASLFDGKTLEGWEVATKWGFKLHGPIDVKDGAIRLGQGQPFTGLRYLGKIPSIGYELEFEAMRTGGDDFFLGVVFPVGDRKLSFVLGGWGGQVVGLTTVDGEPAVENQTCDYVEFEDKKWYKIRLRVTKENISLWIDNEDYIDFDIEESQLDIFWEQEPLLPFGVSCWQTSSAIRAIRARRLDGKKIEPYKPDKSQSSKD